MYNGIGLTTPRGSGTNGYVQNNYSSVKNKRPNNNNYQQRERKDLMKIKSPNVDLLIHEEKKKVEIELYKLKSELTKQGKLSPEEIDQQISDKRKERMKIIENKYNNINNNAKLPSKSEEENSERNEKFKKALSLDKEFAKKGIHSNEEAELVAFDSKLNEMMKRKEKPSSLEKKQRKKKRKTNHKDSSSDSSSDSASSSSDSSDE